jgi:hypothetical protein
MNADLVELAGIALSVWVLGFGMGLLITAFRRFTDQI